MGSSRGACDPRGGPVRTRREGGPCKPGREASGGTPACPRLDLRRAASRTWERNCQASAPRRRPRLPSVWSSPQTDTAYGPPAEPEQIRGLRSVPRCLQSSRRRPQSVVITLERSLVPASLHHPIPRPHLCPPVPGTRNRLSVPVDLPLGRFTESESRGVWPSGPAFVIRRRAFRAHPSGVCLYFLLDHGRIIVRWRERPPEDPLSMRGIYVVRLFVARGAAVAIGGQGCV